MKAMKTLPNPDLILERHLEAEHRRWKERVALLALVGVIAFLVCRRPDLGSELLAPLVRLLGH